MNHTIRIGRESDYNGVARLVAQIHELHVNARPDIYSPDPCPMSKEYFLKILKGENSNVFVVEDNLNSQILAYSVVRIHTAPLRQIFKQRKYINIDDLCVEKTHRGKGIGKSLMNHLMNYSKEIGVGCIELGVSEFNKEAILFYESLGMETRSRRMELFFE